MRGKPVDYFPDELHKLQDAVVNRISVKTNDLATIMFKISLYTKVSESNIHSKIRKREYVYARHLYSYFASLLTRIRLEDIGSFVYEGYDHASVLHGRKAINNLLSYDENVQKDVAQLKKLLKS